MSKAYVPVEHTCKDCRRKFLGHRNARRCGCDRQKERNAGCNCICYTAYADCPHIASARETLPREDTE